MTARQNSQKQNFSLKHLKYGAQHDGSRLLPLHYAPGIFLFLSAGSKVVATPPSITPHSIQHDRNWQKKGTFLQFKTLPRSHVPSFHALVPNSKLTTPGNRGGWQVQRLYLKFLCANKAGTHQTDSLPLRGHDHLNLCSRQINECNTRRTRSGNASVCLHMRHGWDLGLTQARAGVLLPSRPLRWPLSTASRIALPGLAYCTQRPVPLQWC